MFCTSLISLHYKFPATFLCMTNIQSCFSALLMSSHLSLHPRQQSVNSYFCTLLWITNVTIILLLITILTIMLVSTISIYTCVLFWTTSRILEDARTCSDTNRMTVRKNAIAKKARATSVSSRRKNAREVRENKMNLTLLTQRNICNENDLNEEWILLVLRKKNEY